MGVAEVREGSFCFCGLNLEINVLLQTKSMSLSCARIKPSSLVREG